MITAVEAQTLTGIANGEVPIKPITEYSKKIAKVLEDIEKAVRQACYEGSDIADITIPVAFLDDIDEILESLGYYTSYWRSDRAKGKISICW